MTNLAIKLETIHFHDQQITVLNYNNKPYVVMKSIVENIGLDWHAQLNRINRHHVLSKGVVMIATPSKGGIQKYACLPISMINGWLFGIETNRVKPEIRTALEQYQLECFDVLYDHFIPKLEKANEVTRRYLVEVNITDFLTKGKLQLLGQCNDFNALITNVAKELGYKINSMSVDNDGLKHTLNK